MNDTPAFTRSRHAHVHLSHSCLCHTYIKLPRVAERWWWQWWRKDEKTRWFLFPWDGQRHIRHPTHPLLLPFLLLFLLSLQQNQLPEALTKMERVVAVAEERGGDDLKWCFKGLECCVTLLFKLGEYECVESAGEKESGREGGRETTCLTLPLM